MAYDEKTMTEMHEFTERMRSRIEQAAALKEVMTTPRRKRSSLAERLRSWPARALLVFGVFWTAFVTYRTTDSHTVLGVYLERWRDDDFLANWLMPAVVAILFFSARWVLAARKHRVVNTPNVLTEFEGEIAEWPYAQAKAALLLIKAIREDGSGEAIGTLCKGLSREQFGRVIETIKKLDASAE